MGNKSDFIVMSGMLASLKPCPLGCARIPEHKKIPSKGFSVPENQRFSWHPKNKCLSHIVFLITGFFSVLLSIVLVISITPSFGTSYGTNNTVIEDTGIYSYNFTANTTYIPENLPLNYSVDSVHSSLYPLQTSINFYYWMSLNSVTGVLTINTTKDNQTGMFNISIHVLEKDSVSGETAPFYFIVNASNDYPNITFINNSYNMTANTNFLKYVNATDEENHWPFFFNLTFYNNCTMRSWNNRTDCNIFNIVNVSNSSAMMNYTSNKFDAGVYWANVSVMDSGERYNCSSGYCLANYTYNRTYYYPQVIQFNVYTYLEVNASDCKDKVFQENQSNTCWINITSRDFGDNLTYMSNATLRNYSGYVTNASWFFSNFSNFTSNFTYSILVNVTPQKNAIGNWTINFSARDMNYSEYSYDLINISVNRTLNDIPRIAAIANVNTSSGVLFRVNATVFDNDHLIPDKSVFNETINFAINITNMSNSSQTFNFSAFNFTIQILNYTIPGTNRTEGKIELTPNITMAGNFYVNITATDRDGAVVSGSFNLTVKGNLAPLWNESMIRNIIVYEHNLTYLNLSQNVTDPNIDDSVNFTYSINNYFPSFNMNLTTGAINFTANDSDVGLHIVTVIASDGLLTNSTTINFSILNVNETPVIRRPIYISGGSGNSTNGMHATEDSTATITMYVEDRDLAIITEQKSYYNENITIKNLTISGGPNSSLFRFDTIIPAPNNTNYSTFIASFIPRYTDVGSYTIFINASDKSNLSDSITFNLIVDSVTHLPQLVNIENKTTAVNRTLYYWINATSVLDGSSTSPGNTNFTFYYQFLNGTDFIDNNQTIFNTTTGLLNYTFNSSQGGRYRVNITVIDTLGVNVSGDFWIFVYDAPNITYPSSSYQFPNMFENASYIFNFSINQSIQDNVTCEIYIGAINGSVLRNNLSVYGNNTNFSWNLAANYTDETYGLRNLTLITYPANSLLSNATALNTTRRWNFTINHTNAPLLFNGSIGGSNKSIYGGSPQQIILSDYFNDVDASDIYHTQSITFSYSTTSITGTMLVSLTNWANGTTPKIVFSSSSAAKANYTITAYEWNESNSSQQLSNATSNIFSVELTVTPPETTTPASSGGGGTPTQSVPYALKIIVPSKISGYANQKIIVPLKLVNNGKETFNNINLSAIGLKNGTYVNAMKISFDKSYVASLAPGKSTDITMTLIFNTNKTGDYEVTINATSKNPSYTDWSKIYINLQKINESDVRKYVLFTEEYIVQNPSCLELKERLNEANKAMENEDYSNARAIAESVLNACKAYVEQASIPSRNTIFNNKIFQYFIISIVISILAGVGYYYIKRRGYRKNSFKTKYLNIKNP